MDYDTAVRPIFRQFLINSSFSPNLAVDGSVTPVVFQLPGATEGKRVRLTALNIGLTTDAAIKVGGFGDGAAPLPNGVLFQEASSNHPLFQVLVQSNAVVLDLGSKVSYIPAQAGQQYTKVRVEYPHAGPVLDFSAGAYYQAIVQDNLTLYCNSLTMAVDGFYIGETGTF